DDVPVHFAGAAGNGVARGSKRSAFEAATKRRVLRTRLDLPGHPDHPQAGDTHLPLQCGAKHLGDRGFVVRDLALGLHLGDAVAEPAANLELDGARGEFVADLGAITEVGHFAHVVDQVVERAPGHDDAVDGAPLLVERGSRDVPATVLLADAAVDRDADVIEEDFGEVPAAHDVDERPDGDTGRLHVDDEVGDAAVLWSLRVRASEEDAPFGMVGAARPDLLAVDDVFVAIADGARLQGSEVGASAGLAEELAPAGVAAAPGREPAVLLFLCAVHHERGASEPDALVVGAGSAPRAHFLHVDRLSHVAGAGATEFLGPAEREPAAFGEFLAELLGELRLFGGHLLAVVPHIPVFGGEFLVEKFAELGSEGGMLWRVVEEHEVSSVRSAASIDRK